MYNFDEYIDFIKRHFNEEYDEKYNNEYINNIVFTTLLKYCETK